MNRFALALVTLLIAAPALAQEMPHINMMPEAAPKTPEEKEAERQRDKAYRDTLRKIPDAKASNDPWGDVRSSESAKPAAKSASAKPKRSPQGN